LRTAASRGDGRDAESRRVRSQNSFRFGDGVHMGEQSLLELHVFGRGFDDQVDAGDGRVESGGGVDKFQCASRTGWIGDAVLVQQTDLLARAFESLSGALFAAAQNRGTYAAQG